MVEQICKKIAENRDLYIQKITGDCERVYIYVSDKYGNDMDSMPLAYSIEDGKESFLEDEFEAYYGIPCDVPDEYRTYKSLVQSKLEDTVPSNIMDALGNYGLNFPINAIYIRGVSDVTLSQLYAFCNYLINIIAFSCNSDEKSDFGLLLQNTHISDFIRLSNEEKLELVTDYFYIPTYMHTLQEHSMKLFELVEQKKHGNDINMEAYRYIKGDLLGRLRLCKDRVSCDGDLFCDTDILSKKLHDLENNIEQEFSYCEGLNSEVSDRVKQSEESGFKKHSISEFGVTPYHGFARRKFGEPKE